MTHEAKIFEQMTDHEVLALYQQIRWDRKREGLFTPYGKLLGEANRNVYAELKRRGRETDVCLMMLREKLDDMDINELADLIASFEKMTTGNRGRFSGDFTADGDPVTDTGGAISDMIFILQSAYRAKGGQNAE